jgi:predicted ATP-binding protein involved in virulence
MKIYAIRLKNFRLFETFETTFHERCSVFVSPNGQGKTTVIDAVTIALGSYLSQFEHGVNRGFRVNDVRQNSGASLLDGVTRFFPARIEADGSTNSGSTGNWACELRGPKNKTTLGEAQYLAQYGRTLQTNILQQGSSTLPFLAYYGTGRLWQNERVSGKKIKALNSRTSGYQGCFDATSHFRMGAEWFRYLDQNRKMGNSNRQLEGTRHEDYVVAIQDIVDRLVKHTGWHGLEFDFDRETLVMHHDAYGTLSVEELSDGIRIMVALAFDMASRMIRLNSHLDAKSALSAPGIAMIDEVDMHLHPAWQQTVVTDLVEAFPSLQFILTTHSPHVLSSIPKEYIRVIGPTSAEIPASQTRGRESSSVLASVMETDPRPPVPEVKDLEQYVQWLEQGHNDFAAIQQLRERLQAHFGDSEPRMVRAELIANLRTQQGR